MNERFPITCKCGETWSQEEWKELPLVGKYDAQSDGWIELRTCVCGATLTIPTEPPPK
jgi:hypothetical protein